MKKRKSVQSAEVRYREGFLDGLAAEAWTCGDCGNTYGAQVLECPNANSFDEAYAALRQAKWQESQ